MGNGKVYLSCCSSCKCRHGWIICADGTESEQFATVSKGMKVLAKLVSDGKVPSDVTQDLMRLIAISELQLKNTELDEIFETMEKERIAFFTETRGETKEEPDIVSRFEGKPERTPAKRTLN